MNCGEFNQCLDLNVCHRTAVAVWPSTYSHAEVMSSNIHASETEKEKDSSSICTGECGDYRLCIL